MGANVKLADILAELQTTRTSYLSALTGISTQITNLHNQVVTVKNNTAGTNTLLTTMDGRLSSVKTNTDSLLTAMAALSTLLTTMDGRLAAVKEDTNALIFHTTQIEEWSLRGFLDPLLVDMYNLVSTVAGDSSQLRGLLNDFIAPNIENTFRGVIDLQTYTLALACLCDLEANPLGPPLDTAAPADEGVHCQRVQYMLDAFVVFVNQVRVRLQSGASMNNGTIAYLLGINLVPGITEESIPNDIKLGLTNALSGDTDATFDAMVTILDNYESLKTLFWAADNASEAKSLVDSYFDSHNPGGETGDKAVRALKLIFNATLINTLFDQAGTEWEIDGYANDACQEPDSGEYTIIYSLDTILAEDPGNLDQWHAVEQALHYGYLTNFPGTTYSNGTLVTFRQTGFTEGDGFNNNDVEDLFINDDLWHDRRVKYESGGEIHIRINNTYVHTIDAEWYRFPTIGTDTITIVAANPGEPFTLRAQRLFGGQWVDF